MFRNITACTNINVGVAFGGVTNYSLFYYASLSDYSVDITMDATSGPTVFSPGVHEMTLFVQNTWGYMIYAAPIANVSV